MTKENENIILAEILEEDLLEEIIEEEVEAKVVEPEVQEIEEVVVLSTPQPSTQPLPEFESLSEIFEIEALSSGELGVEQVDNNTSLDYSTAPSPINFEQTFIEPEQVLFTDNSLPTEFFGTAGDDVIVGDSADNILFGLLGDDVLTGGAGADQFMPSEDDYFSFFHFDEVTDFNVAEGDTINLSDVLDNFGQSGFSNDIADYFEIFDSGVDTFIRIDPTGTGTHDAIMQLTGVTGLPDEATLIANGTVTL